MVWFGIHEAVFLRDMPRLCALLRTEPASVHACSAYGCTPLMVASGEGWWPGVEALLDAGAPCDVRDEQGLSALWLACDSGHTRIVQRLLREGADPGALRLRDHVSCLHIAVARGHKGVVAAILACATGKPKFEQDEEGEGEEEEEAGGSDAEAAAAAAKATADDPPPPAPPSLARRSSSHVSSHSCLSSSACGCSFTIGDGHDDGSAADWDDEDESEQEEEDDDDCESEHDTESVWSVDEEGEEGAAVVNLRDEEGRNALHHAADHGDPCIVTMLLQAGADPWTRDLFKCTPAHRARLKGHTAATVVIEEPERAMLLCRLRILNDAYNAGCAPSALLQDGKAQAASGATGAASKPESEDADSDVHAPPTKRRLIASATAATAAVADKRPVTFACQHSSSRSLSSSALRRHLARCVLRRVVGGGDEDGKGAGLQPDLFEELLAYVRAPWDPALAGAAPPR